MYETKALDVSCSFQQSTLIKIGSFFRNERQSQLLIMNAIGSIPNKVSIQMVMMLCHDWVVKLNHDYDLWLVYSIPVFACKQLLKEGFSLIDYNSFYKSIFSSILFRFFDFYILI